MFLPLDIESVVIIGNIVESEGAISGNADPVDEFILYKYVSFTVNLYKI